eukprot:1801147-Amphidinium_carterae.1
MMALWTTLTNFWVSTMSSITPTRSWANSHSAASDRAQRPFFACGWTMAWMGSSSTSSPQQSKLASTNTASTS